MRWATGTDGGADAAGNLTYDGRHKYTYDAWNRMCSVGQAYRDSNGTVQSGYAVGTYWYDGLHRRTRQVSNSAHRSFLQIRVYDTRWRPLEDLHWGGYVRRQYVWGARYIDELVQIAVNEDPDDANESVCERDYYALTNANFNVMALVDANGQLVERYEYTPYGQRTVYKKSGPDDDLTSAPLWGSQRVVTSDDEEQPYGLNDIGHQGLPHDDESGLIYNRHRYVIPRLGRYNGPDPAGYVDGMNRSEYLGSNPIIFVDPEGLWFKAERVKTERTCVDGENYVRMTYKVTRWDWSWLGWEDVCEETDYVAWEIQDHKYAERNTDNLMNSEADICSRFEDIEKFKARIKMIPGGTTAGHIVDGEYGWAVVSFGADVAMTCITPARAAKIGKGAVQVGRATCGGAVQVGKTVGKKIGRAAATKVGSGLARAGKGAMARLGGTAAGDMMEGLVRVSGQAASTAARGTKAGKAILEGTVKWTKVAGSKVGKKALAAGQGFVTRSSSTVVGDVIQYGLPAIREGAKGACKAAKGALGSKTASIVGRGAMGYGAAHARGLPSGSTGAEWAGFGVGLGVRIINVEVTVPDDVKSKDSSPSDSR